MIEKTLIAFKVGEVDRNGRVFTRKALEQAVEDYVNFPRAYRRYGYLVSDLGNQLATITHFVDALYFDGDAVKADISIYDTPKGKIIQEMLSEGLEIELSYECKIPIGDGGLENMKIVHLNIDLCRGQEQT